MCARSMLARGCVFKKREGDTLKVADPVTCLLVRLILGQEELVLSANVLGVKRIQLAPRQK